jgi:hypothetical protein|tara:strand:+ start:4854 stop:5156 length:303 start_codon:yes stop_codon:yes gene_type:complete
MLGATNFLGDFVKDEMKCRVLSVEDFGAPLDNEKNDVPLYDMYNRGLAACEEGMNRKNLGQRPGLTGYIPSMEEGMKQGASVKPKTLLMVLDSPNSKTKK